MTSQELALRQATADAIEQFRDPRFVTEMESIVPAGVSAAAILGAARRAVAEEPMLGKLELRAALLRASLKAGADGLLPDKREAAFIYFGGREPTIVYMPMIGGLRKVAAEHGWDLRGDIIYENDTFEDRTADGVILHQKPRPGVDRGKVEGAWAMAVHRDRNRPPKAKVMDLKQIEKVRQTSRAKDRGPWVDWWEEMALKTVARRLFKELPLDPNDKRVLRVLESMDNGDAEDRVNVLYGEATRIIDGTTGEIIDSQDRSATGRVSSHLDATDAAGEEGEIMNDGSPDSPADSVVEPTDEELDAMSGEKLADTLRWPSGKYSAGQPAGGEHGLTIREVWEMGGRERNYVKWAAGFGRDDGWKNEEFRAQVATALAELEAEEAS